MFTSARQSSTFFSDRSIGFSVDWFLRRGLVPDPEHRMFPADPGSPADKELRAEAAANEGRVRLYTPEGPLTLRLDGETDRFVIDEEG